MLASVVFEPLGAKLHLACRGGDYFMHASTLLFVPILWFGVGCLLDGKPLVLSSRIQLNRVLPRSLLAHSCNRDSPGEYRLRVKPRVSPPPGFRNGLVGAGAVCPTQARQVPPETEYYTKVGLTHDAGDIRRSLPLAAVMSTGRLAYQAKSTCRAAGRVARDISAAQEIVRFNASLTKNRAKRSLRHVPGWFGSVVYRFVDALNQTS